MEQMNRIKSFKSILVTSTRSFTDSNTIAADIATLVARNGKKVALVDADLRRPVIHKLFDLPNRVGLCDVLSGSRSPLAVMHHLDNKCLSILPGGILAKGNGDLIGSPKMVDLLQLLKSQFDKVIIHGPPFFFSEAATLAAQVDGVVLLIHPGYSQVETSQSIIERFQKTGATIIGIVMRSQPRYQTGQTAFIDRLLTYDQQARLASK